MRSVLLLALLTGLASGLSAQEAVGTNQPLFFRAVDVFVDSGTKPLAAYQLQLTAEKADVKIVGIEGGEHPAFQTPPFYDPKAIQQERMVLASFNTAPADKLPKGKTRVATVHFQIPSSEPAQFAVKVQTAATVDGKKISVQASVEERKVK